VSDDIVLAGADSAQQIPVLAFVTGEKDVAVGRAEVNLVWVTRIGL
jgi:hypothetical protein